MNIVCNECGECFWLLTDERDDIVGTYCPQCGSDDVEEHNEPEAA